MTTVFLGILAAFMIAVGWNVLVERENRRVDDEAEDDDQKHDL